MRSQPTRDYTKHIGTASRDDHAARDIIRTVIGPNPRGRILRAIKDAAKQQQSSEGHVRELDVTCMWRAPESVVSCNTGIVEYYLKAALHEAFKDFISEVENRNGKRKVTHVAASTESPALSAQTASQQTSARNSSHRSFEFFTHVKVAFSTPLNF